MRQPHYFTLLTQSEWKMLFSISFVSISDYFKDAYPISEYATPGFEGPTKDWLELMLRSARYMGLKHGYRFEGLQVRDNGSVGGPLVEPGNENYSDMLRGGGLPNLPLAFSTAIDTLLSFDPTFDVGPIRAALSQVYEDLDRIDDWEEEADPEGEHLGEISGMRKEAYHEALRLLGLSRDKEVIH